MLPTSRQPECRKLRGNRQPLEAPPDPLVAALFTCVHVNTYRSPASTFVRGQISIYVWTRTPSPPPPHLFGQRGGGGGFKGPASFSGSDCKLKVLHKPQEGKALSTLFRQVPRATNLILAQKDTLLTPSNALYITFSGFMQRELIKCPFVASLGTGLLRKISAGVQQLIKSVQ